MTTTQAPMAALDPTGYLLARYAEDETRARERHARCSGGAGSWPAIYGRMLAGIAAKRAAVYLHRDTSGYGYCDVCHYTVHGETKPYPYPCLTVRALLQEYADRQDLPAEWRSAWPGTLRPSDAGRQEAYTSVDLGRCQRWAERLAERGLGGTANP